MESVRIEDLTWPKIRDLISSGHTRVVCGMGSTEQHGPALPEKTDSAQADYVANALARKLGRTLQAPTIAVGCSEHHLAFPGTISLRKETLMMIIEDYVSSLIRHGFKTIIILPLHGGNFAPLAETLPRLKDKPSDVRILAFCDLGLFLSHVERTAAELGFDRGEVNGHADLWESSNMLMLDAEHVNPGEFARGYTGMLDAGVMRKIFSEGMPAVTENGILGDSRRAKAGYGRLFLERLVDFLYERVAPELDGE